MSEEVATIISVGAMNGFSEHGEVERRYDEEVDVTLPPIGLSDANWISVDSLATTPEAPQQEANEEAVVRQAPSWVESAYHQARVQEEVEKALLQEMDELEAKQREKQTASLMTQISQHLSALNLSEQASEQDPLDAALNVVNKELETLRPSPPSPSEQLDSHFDQVFDALEDLKPQGQQIEEEEDEEMDHQMYEAVVGEVAEQLSYLATVIQDAVTRLTDLKRKKKQNAVQELTDEYQHQEYAEDFAQYENVEEGEEYYEEGEYLGEEGYEESEHQVSAEEQPQEQQQDEENKTSDSPVQAENASTIQEGEQETKKE